MAFQPFTDEQELTQSTDMQRLLPLLATTAAAGGGDGGGVAPTWFSNAVTLRQQSLLHSQTEDVRGGMIPSVKSTIDQSDRNPTHGNFESEDLAEYKRDILGHPLYDQLLSAHVSCLRMATPVDQLPRIDAQMRRSKSVVEKYSVLGNGVVNEKELDQFMMHYVLLLGALKEQLRQQVCVHAMEAVKACWELEECLQSLTGVSPTEGTGATMSDDEDDLAESNTNLSEGGLDGADGLSFGPLVPTGSERSLMERVRRELKHELKQGYKEKIVDVREEILRKRRAGKLPGDTTFLLKAWWQSHSSWPYPTEEDKARLVQETGLELRQINNWFINQRKRNWHTNASSFSASKSKRKRW